MTTKHSAPLKTFEIRQLVVARRRRFGYGLQGGYEQIARWLFREHNILTTDAWICEVIKNDQT